MKTQESAAKTILTPTSGFLQDGYTHTINLYRGCALGNSLCGTFCYAQHNRSVTKGRAWGSFLDVKTGQVEAYQRDYDRLKHRQDGAPKPLRIYMSSVTDPDPPQEKLLRRTRALAAGFDDWNQLGKLTEVLAIFRTVFADERRITISRAGFNQIGTIK